MNITYPSILPYLQTEPGKITLRLARSSSRISPFSFLDDELDPLARLLPGAFVTDSGAVIKEVNLLIQRDRFACSEGIEEVLKVLPGLTNSKVEYYWRRSMKIRRARASEHILSLGMQLDEEGVLLPFSSLFYCRNRECFFEPPCPDCGQRLQLCRDDAQLRSGGLMPYMIGLRRYLFCPSCYAKTSPQQVWYTLEKKNDEPATVHDTRALLQYFARIDVGTSENEVLPCLHCQERVSCYGPQQNVYANIFIFSFYPFYMMLLERDCLDGFHFLTPGGNEKLDVDSQEGLQHGREMRGGASDQALHTLLRNIAHRWRQEEMQLSLSEQLPSLADTVIQQGISRRRDASSDGETTLDETLLLGKARTTFEEPDDLSTETVLITRTADFEAQSAVQTSTVSLSETSLKTDKRPPLDEKNAAREDVPAETVILRPERKR